ncbi:hypothetical protein JW935_14795 [candidate division KSB1 bacterium]|nr:hypothetical protein [candidate division KSB1 bacterium]
MGRFRINILLFLLGVFYFSAAGFQAAGSELQANKEPWSVYMFSDGRIAHHGNPDGVERIQSDGTTQINLFFVLDASISMKKKPSGSKLTKIEMAKQVISQVLTNIPASVQCSFWIFGHRSPEKSKAEACEDIEEVFPLQPIDAAEMSQKMENVNPIGGSPLARCLQKLKSKCPIEGNTGIILIVDGGESCSGDPCAESKVFKSGRGRCSLHIAGIDVDEREQEQLTCIAQNSGGMFSNALLEDQLFSAVSNAVNATLNLTTLMVKTTTYDGKMKGGNIYLCQPFSEEPIFTMRTWTNIAIPDGLYDLIVETTPLTLFQNLEINAGYDNIININIGAIRVQTPQGQSAKVTVRDVVANKPLGEYEGILEFIPGAYELEINNSKSAGIEVKEGKAADMNLGALQVMAHDQSSMEAEVFSMAGMSLGVKSGVVFLIPGSYKISINSSKSGIVQVEPGKTTRIVLGAVNYRKSYDILDYEGVNMGQFKGMVELIPGNYTVVIPGQAPKQIAVESGNTINLE